MFERSADTTIYSTAMSGVLTLLNRTRIYSSVIWYIACADKLIRKSTTDAYVTLIPDRFGIRL